MKWQTRRPRGSALLEDQGVGSGPNPGNLPNVVGIILPLISIWNYQLVKTNHATYCRLHLPSAMAHTLSMECASLWIWIKPLFTYHFVSHWILSAMRHQEPELPYVLKPGTVGLGWVWVPAMCIQVQSRVLVGFKSQPCGFKSKAGFWLGLSPSHVGSSPKQGFGWVWVPATWVQVPIWGKWFQFLQSPNSC